MHRRRQPARSSSRPTVTVVVPCYNYGHFLPTAVTSVLRQPGVEVEVIVIDDASTDGSASVARHLAESDARVHAILHTDNQGHIATYNEGLEQATGDYLVLLSADDALAPGALQRATALLAAEPSVAFTYGFSQTCHGAIPAASDLPPRTNVRSWSIWSGEDWIAGRCRTGLNCIQCPEVVMRASVQSAIGGYDAALPHSGDFEMWMRAATVGDVGRVNGPAQAYYRVHNQSMQRTIYCRHLHDVEARLAAFQKVLVGPEAHLTRGAELFAIARRTLSADALRHVRGAYIFDRMDTEDMGDYFAFAADVWPSAPRTRAWRSAARANVRSSQGRRGLHHRACQFGDAVEARMRWQRRRWIGV